MFPKRYSVFAIAFLLSASSAFSQGSAKLKSELLFSYDDASKKIIDLAEAVPEDKYSYKPGDGVRSMGQVFVHLGSANLFIPNSMGVKPPASVKMSRDMEKTMTAKAEIVDLLKKSMEHGRMAISTAVDKDPEAAIKLFGRESTNTGGAVLIVSHMHEHLGQLIAYSRAAGVKPPWAKSE